MAKPLSTKKPHASIPLSCNMEMVEYPDFLGVHVNELRVGIKEQNKITNFLPFRERNSSAIYRSILGKIPFSKLVWKL